MSEAEGQGVNDAEIGRKLKFPTAFTVLGVVLLVVWIASFLVPAGIYNTDPKTGGPIPGSYHKLPSCSSVQAGGNSLDVPSAAETRHRARGRGGRTSRRSW